VPSLLIPLPGAMDDHQTANARALERTGGAWLLPQHEADAGTLARRLTVLMKDPAALNGAAGAIREAARPNAAALLVDAVEAALTRPRGARMEALA